MLSHFLPDNCTPGIILFVLVLMTNPVWAEDQPQLELPPKSEQVGEEAPSQEGIQERGIPLPTDKILVLLPDITATIKQDWMDNFHLQYKANIRVVNKGKLPMPAVQVLTLGMRYNPASTPPNPSQCIPNNNCKIKNQRTIGPLAPGEAKKYNVDPKFTAAETVIVEVKIICNPPNDCRESNVQNNQVRKVLGPH
jgi:hypothetical protein